MAGAPASFPREGVDARGIEGEAAGRVADETEPLEVTGVAPSLDVLGTTGTVPLIEGDGGDAEVAATIDSPGTRWMCWQPGHLTGP